jgi:long-chain acyl-CoA synthetase
MKIFSRDRLLSVIPLAHTYECTLGMLTAVMSGASVTYLDKPPSPAILLPAMQTLRPTAIVSVPLFIEKICRNLIFPALGKSPFYKLPPPRLIALKAAGNRLMAAMGSSIRFFGIGGAPLAEDVEYFLRKAGFPYSPGYGLTETSPLVAGTAPYRFPFRSAGLVLKGVEVRIGDDGEIQVRGPNVMLGYYRDEERTRSVFTGDGWFKTGDIGSLDRKGRLFIRGRLKALILGPSGENIYPEEIEELIHTSQLVEVALVIPGERGELVALIVISEKAKTALAALEDGLEELKNQVNKRLAAFSRLNRIEVRGEPVEKTPTQKIKRFLYSTEKPLLKEKD